MKRAIQRLSARLERPDVGARAILQSLQTKNISPGWTERILGSASWLLILVTTFVTGIAFLQKRAIEVTAIAILLGVYLAYVLLLEVTSRRWKNFYEKPLSRALRIGVNLVTVTVLVWFSAGQDSYFWFFYTLPIFQAIVYFAKPVVVATTVAAIVLYWAVVTAGVDFSATFLDFALLTMNSLILSLLSFVLYWLFGSASESRKLKDEELSALQETARDLVAQLDRDQLLQTVIRWAIKLLRARGGGIYEYDASKSTLTLIATGDEGHGVEGDELAIGQDMAGRVTQSGKPFIVNDYQTWLERAPAREHGHFHAVVAVPLKWGDHILGVLYVNDDERRRNFDERDAYVLGLLASQAAIAMLEETRRRAYELERKAQQLKLINDIATLANSSLELKQILQIAVTEMAKVFAVKQSGIVVFDHQAGYGQVWAEYQEEKNATAEAVKIPLKGNPIMERILSKRCPIFVEDAQNSPLTTAIRDVIKLRKIRSILIVPLIVNNETYGTIGMDALDEPRIFNEEEIALAQTIANHIAIAVGNARLFETTQRNLRQLEALDRISKMISATPTIEGILQVTLEEGMRTVGADEGSVMLIDPITGKLEIKAWLVRGSFLADKSHRKFGLGEGIAGYVALTGKAYYCPNIEQDPYFIASNTERRVLSLLCVPILARGRVLGTITADSPQLSFFQKDDMQFLAALAGHVATAIESYRLKEIGIALSTVNLDTLLARIVESASILTGAEFSTLFLLDEPSGQLKRAQNFPPSRQTSGGPRPNGFSYEILSSGNPVNIQDVQNHPRVKQDSKSQKVQSIIGVPLKVRMQSKDASLFRTIGVLWVNTRQRRQFSNRDVKLLESLASHAAVAIENARLFEDIHRHSLDLETLYKTSLLKDIEAARRQIKQLEEQITAVQTVNFTFLLLSRWGHKAKQKIFALKQNVDSLKQDLPVALFDGILDSMSESLEELSLPAQNLLTDAENGLQQSVEWIDLRQLLNDVAVKLCSNCNVPITLIKKFKSKPRWVKGNLLLLETAIELLIENAIESMEQTGMPGTLKLKCFKKDLLIKVRISDTGKGIPSEILQNLYQGPVASDTGFGYGSFTVANILRAHKGDIRVVQTGKGATCIEFWLPLAKRKSPPEVS